MSRYCYECWTREGRQCSRIVEAPDDRRPGAQAKKGWVCAGCLERGRMTIPNCRNFKHWNRLPGIPGGSRS